MKKILLAIFLSILFLSCATTNEIVIKGDSGYIISKKDTTRLTTDDVLYLKILFAQDEEIFKNDLKESISNFYDRNVDVDTLGINF